MKTYSLEQLVSGGFDKLNNNNIKDTLEEEAKELGRIILKHYRKYSEYTPKQYVRTYKTEKGLENAMSKVKVKKMGNGVYVATLEFENSLMYHDSVVKKSTKKGHSLMLISDGWNKGVRETKHSRMLGKQVYRFTYYEGYNILGRAIEEYKSKMPKGMTIEINWSNVYYK